VFLYVVQFLLMPVVPIDYWCGLHSNAPLAEAGIPARLTKLCRLSLFFGNSLYLAASIYYVIITFLGYNGQYRLSSPPFPSPFPSPPSVHVPSLC